MPEVNDVDMHLWFHEDDAWLKYLGTVPQALEVQKGGGGRGALSGQDSQSRCTSLCPS